MEFLEKNFLTEDRLKLGVASDATSREIYYMQKLNYALFYAMVRMKIVIIMKFIYIIIMKS